MRVIKLTIYESENEERFLQFLSNESRNGTKIYDSTKVNQLIVTTRTLSNPPISTSEIEQVINEHELAVAKLENNKS